MTFRQFTLLCMLIVLLGTAIVSLYNAPQEAVVVEVVDGDTIKIRLDGRTETVRYIGINTPEWDEPGGEEATAFNTKLLKGKTVTLERDRRNRDVYGRLLRYVFLDGAFVNQILVSEGYAKAISYPPNTKYDWVLQSAE